MLHDPDQLSLSLAAELHGARAELESLSETLCADPYVVLEHAAALQTLDRVGQLQAAIASLLVAADRPAAVAALGLDRLRERLMQRDEPGRPDRATSTIDDEYFAGDLA
jgi:hypothetical protein